MKKTAKVPKKLSLHVETLLALDRRSLEVAAGAHYSIPAHYTCPECASPSPRR